MFYCGSCATKMGWPWHWYDEEPVAYRRCEVCGDINCYCVSRPTTVLPVPKLRDGQSAAKFVTLVGGPADADDR